MVANVLMSECFSSNEKRHYFLDFKKSSRDSKFIQISRSDLLANGSYQRSFVIVFEQDFHFLIAAMSSLFHHAAYLKEDGKNIYALRKENAHKNRGGIPSWEPTCKPREKLMAHGAAALQDCELLAIMIGSGTAGEDAVALAGRLLEEVGSLSNLATQSISSLKCFKGIGEAKATMMKAMMEIAKRCKAK